MPAAKKVTVTAIATELSIDIADTISLLQQFGVMVEKPEDEITQTIATRFLNTVKGIESETKAIAGASDSEGTPGDSPNTDNNSSTNPNQETSSDLTLAQAKTIAQTSKVSIKTIQNMAITLKNRQNSVSLQTGFADTQSAIAHYNMGGMLANLLEYNRRNKELDETQRVIAADELNPTEVLKELGFDLEGLLNNQEKDAVTRQEWEVKNDPLEVMRQRIAAMTQP